MALSLTALRHRGFRLLVGGQLASNVGDAFYAVALPWYVLADHGSALLLAAVLGAYGIPRTVLLVFGGQASDRWHPWTVMMVADGVRAVAVGAMAAAAFSGSARAIILVPIAAVIGAGEGIFLPGSYSIIPSLLPDVDLQAGNALSSSGTQLATLIGPAIGGALVAVGGAAPAFVVDAASFLISAATLAGVRTAQRSDPDVASTTTGANPDAVTDTLANQDDEASDATPPPSLLHLFRSQRVLQIILLTTLAANLGSGGFGEVALPSLAHGPLHAGAGGYGALIATFGAGALVGTLLAGHVHDLHRPAMVSSAVFLAEAIFMAAIPFAGGIVPAGVALAFFGGLNGFGNVVIVTAFQRWAPPELLGRLMGVLLLCSFGIFPVSVFVGGIVVHDFGPAPFFPIAGAILAVAIAGALTQRAWREFGAVPEPMLPVR